MRTMLFAVALVMLGAVAVSAHPEADEGLHFKQHGFTIRPLKAKSTDNVVTQVARFVSIAQLPSGRIESSRKPTPWSITACANSTPPLPRTRRRGALGARRRRPARPPGGRWKTLA